MSQNETPESLYNFSRKIREEAYTLDLKTIKRIARDLNLKFHGSGQSCAVVSVGEKDEKIFAIHYTQLDPVRAKKMFYEQKILSTFFPHNFPKFYGASGELDSEHQGISGTIRQKITGATGGKVGYVPGDAVPQMSAGTSRKHQELFAQLEQSIKISKHPSREIKYPSREAQIQLRSLGMLEMVDVKPENFILGEDGGEYYVDTEILSPVTKWNMEAIRKYLEEHIQNNDEKETITRCIRNIKSFKSRESLNKLNFFV